MRAVIHTGEFNGMNTILQIYIQSINSLLQRFDSDSLFTAKLIASLTLLLNVQVTLYMFDIYPVFESTDAIEYLVFGLIIAVLFVGVHLATESGTHAIKRANFLVKEKPYIAVLCWGWFTFSMFIFPLL